MDKETLIKRLKQASKAIDLALKGLVSNDANQGESIGTCAYCKKPIFEGEDLTREIHTNPCYTRAFRRVNDGELTWEQLESAGRIGPPGKPGRKRITDEEAIADAEKLEKRCFY